MRPGSETATAIAPASVAARIAVGLDLMFNNPAFLELFFEIAFVMNVVPGIWLDIEGGLGVRFYF